MKRLISLLLTGIILSAPLVAVPKAFAASASMSLTGARTVGKGSTLTVSIYESSDVPVNAAKATLSYPANLLDFVSIGSSSAFSIVAANSGGGGTVRVDRGALPEVSGRKLVATVRFKAKTDTGTATINITDGSVLSTSSQNILGGKAGMSVTLTPPVAAPVAPPKDTTPPTITNVKVGDITHNSAVVTWTTSEPATSIVEYGFNTSYGITAADTNLVTEHKITLNPNVLIPVSEVHFVVKSADGAGNAVSDKDKNFKTKGLPLTVTVLDQKKKAVVGAKVTLEGKTISTDNKGQAKFTDLRTGTISGSVDYSGKQTGITVVVKPIGAEAQVSVQSATLNIKAQKTSGVLLIPLVILLLLAAVVVWMIRSGRDQTLISTMQDKFKKKDDGAPKPPVTPVTPAGPAGSGTAVVEGASKGVTGITMPKNDANTAGNVVQPTNPSSSNDSSDDGSL